MNWNLNNATAQRLGQSQHHPQQQQQQLRQSENRDNQNNLDPFTGATTADPVQQRFQRNTPNLFRNHHRSVVGQEHQQRLTANQEDQVMGMSQGRLTQGNLYRAPRPKIWLTPADSYAQLPEGLRTSNKRPHTPLYSQMAPKLTKTRQLIDVQFEAAEKDPFCTTPNRTTITAAQQQPRLINTIMNAQDLLKQQELDEQSTSKPSYEMPDQKHIVRNPTLQSNLLQQDKIQKQQKDYKQKQQHISMNMSLGKNINVPRNGGPDLQEEQKEKQGQQLKPLSRMADLGIATKAVLEKLDVQFQISEDYSLSDLANQTLNQGGAAQADYKPLKFLPSQSMNIPQQIQQEMSNVLDVDEKPVLEMSKRHPIVYFGISNRLYVWDYMRISQQQQQQPRQYSSKNEGLQNQRFQESINRQDNLIAERVFDEEITSICELNSVNRFSNWQQASQAQQDCRYILVTTSREIKLIAVKRDTNYGKLIVHETNLNALEQGSTQMMVEFEKTGRVFYGREGGRISELTFINTENQRVTQNTSKISQVTKMAKNFVLGSSKRLYRIEHQKDLPLLRVIPNLFGMTKQIKNIIKLCVDEQRNLMYSLSISESSYTKGQSVIEVFDLGFFGDEFKHQTTIQMYELVEAMDKVYGRPRDISMTKYKWAELHNIVDIQPVQYSESQTFHLIMTTCNCERIYLRLGTKPRGVIDENKAMDQLENLGLQSDFLITEQIVQGTWEVVSIKSQYPDEDFVCENQNFATGVMYEPFSEHSLPRRNQRSIYYQKEPLLSHHDNGESLFVFQTTGGENMNQFDSPDNFEDKSIRLGFIQKNTAMYSQARSFYQENQVSQLVIQESFSLIKFAQDHQQQELEQILQIQGLKAQAESLGSLVAMGQIKIQKLKPTWGDHTYVTPYLPCNETEKQVYLKGGKMCLLTNQRLIEIKQMRPIDHLFNLLIFIQESRRSESDLYDDFVDFASTYTMDETCSMLIQIIADRQANYSVSHRISSLLNMKRTMVNQQSRMNQHQQYNSKYPSTRNMRSAGTTSLTRKFGGGLHQATQLSHRNTFHGRTSMSGSRKPSAAEEPLDYPNGQVNLEESQLKNILNNFDQSNLGNEVHERPLTKSIAQVALDLLSQFGDSVSNYQYDVLKSCIQVDQRPQNCTSEASNLYLYSSKHKAVYLYLYRVLRPIWKMNITSYVSASKLRFQELNLDSMMPTKDKLIKLHEMIHTHERVLIGQTCKNRDLIPPSSQLHRQNLLLNQVEIEVSEFIQVAERQSLAHLKAFVRRCIDVIEFLTYIETEVVVQQRRKFSDYVHALGLNIQERLSKHKFLDLVNGGAQNDIVIKMLEATISMQASEDANLTEQTIHLKQQAISQLCPTLFSPLESRLFLGQSMLKTASYETDQMRKDELVSKAIDNLLIDPERIDMEQIAPMLAKNKQFQQIVYLCLEKIKYKQISNNESIEEIEQLLNIIVQLFEALDTQIMAGGKPKVVDKAVFSQELATMELEQKLVLRDNLVVQLSECDLQEPIAHLLRAFLVMNKDVDFIGQKVSSTMIEKQCTKFVIETSNQGLLKRSQFQNVYRVLSKAKQPLGLADMVIDVLLQKIILMEDGAAGHQDDDCLVRCKLTCDERLKLAQQTIQLMSHCSVSSVAQENPNLNLPQGQITGQAGDRIEHYHEMQRQIGEIMNILSTQAQAIKSVQDKIKLMENYQRLNLTNKNDREKNNKLSALWELLNQLEYTILTREDLHALYLRHDLHDRQMLLLLDVPATTPEAANRLQDLQMQALSSLVDDLQLYCAHSQSLFTEEFKKQILTIFTKDVLETKKSLLFYVIDLLNDKVDCIVQNLIRNDPLWPQQFMILELCIAPSQVLRHYTSLLQDKPLCFKLCLSLIREWSRKLKSPRTKPDVQKSFYQDLLTHGTNLYQEVIIRFCHNFITSEDEKLLLPKNEWEAFEKLFYLANGEMADLLELHVPTFNRNIIVSLPLSQNLIKPQSVQPARVKELPQDADMVCRGPRVISNSMGLNVTDQGADKQANTPPPLVQQPDETEQDQREQRRNRMERSHRATKTFTSGGSLSRLSQPSQQQQQQQYQQPPQLLNQSVQDVMLRPSHSTSNRPLYRARPEDNQGSQLLLDDEPKIQEIVENSDQIEQQQLPPQPSLKQMRERSKSQNRMI